MSRELDISGVLAIGNGEPCPFCKNNEFIMEEGKDFIKHCVESHPSEINQALFSAKPKIKYWLESEFTGLIAHIAAKLRFIDTPERITDEDYESTMEEIYHLIDEYKKVDNESD